MIILGASAAGLMCAIEAGKRGKNVLVLDHANKAGKKILMSGGGRCNFTNLNISSENYISQNPHFCKSALKQYTQWDFIDLVEQHHIQYHERKHGQLFCIESAKDILNMLLYECEQVNANIKLNCSIESITQDNANIFITNTNKGSFNSEALVVATGGLSIPKMCASPLGYQLAKQFGHHIWPTSAGLVPFTLHEHDKEKLAELSGVSIDSVVSNSRIQFNESSLFTHRGLSGPAMLQISSYWQAGETITLKLLPDLELLEHLLDLKNKDPNTKLKTILNTLLPKRLVPILFEHDLLEKPLQEISKDSLQKISNTLQAWDIKPNGTEGYRTAEVTLGGVDCDEISSKTMESKKINGLYFIGEVLDVTGWLGGYNFQWAWSSGWCAGQSV